MNFSAFSQMNSYSVHCHLRWYFIFYRNSYADDITEKYISVTGIIKTWRLKICSFSYSVCGKKCVKI